MLTYVELFKELHDGDFPLPDFSNPTYITGSNYKDSAAAVIKVTTETILTVRDGLSNYERARAVKFLFDDLRNKLISLGLDDTHMFLLKDPERFSHLLMKHFGFKEAEGKAMYWNG